MLCALPCIKRTPGNKVYASLTGFSGDYCKYHVLCNFFLGGDVSTLPVGFLHKAFSQFMQFKVGDKELLKIQSYRCKDSFKDLKINNEDYIN